MSTSTYLCYVSILAKAIGVKKINATLINKIDSKKLPVINLIMSTEMLLYKQINKLDPKKVSKKLELFLKEDIPTGDVTTDNVIPADTKEVFAITSREPMVFCGNPIIENIFSNRVKIKKMVKDGQKLLSGEIIAILSGSNSEILTKERLLLNMIQRMSGVSSLTSRYVEKLNNNQIKVLDTRKTTPGLRIFEKYAVFCGGGSNHRLNLSCGIMVKDNHINKITDEVINKPTKLSPKFHSV